jgi:dsRNA-specific ribonuclease
MSGTLTQLQNVSNVEKELSSFNQHVDSYNSDLKAFEQKEYKLFDLDILHLHNLKIFGDVFESLIGAVFLDSRSLDKTEEILFNLIGPYIELYADLQTMSDHPRTILLQLWP